MYFPALKSWLSQGSPLGLPEQREPSPELPPGTLPLPREAAAGSLHGPFPQELQAPALAARPPETSTSPGLTEGGHTTHPQGHPGQPLLTSWPQSLLVTGPCQPSTAPLPELQAGPLRPLTSGPPGTLTARPPHCRLCPNHTEPKAPTPFLRSSPKAAGPPRALCRFPLRGDAPPALPWGSAPYSPWTPKGGHSPQDVMTRRRTGANDLSTQAPGVQLLLQPKRNSAPGLPPLLNWHPESNKRPAILPRPEGFLPFAAGAQLSSCQPLKAEPLPRAALP